ncbi:MAG: helix-turn-helix domain-containing protein [Thermonemataceae bacterium]
MSLEQQFIFLFSALGALNGFTVSGYVFLQKREKQYSHYFLGGLLLVLSIRIIKSVFLYFNGHLFDLFIQLGLAACSLIGPFLYLYIRSVVKESPAPSRYWWLIFLYPASIFIFGFFYPYYEYRFYWKWFVELIYKQWMVYIFLTGYLLFPSVKQAYLNKTLWKDTTFWLLNIYLGTAIIWLAYETSHYTSYIVGALSFTFILYLSLLLWRSKKYLFTPAPTKYAGSLLDDTTLEQHRQKLEAYMTQHKPYLDATLTIRKLSEQLAISSKDLSQVINQATGYNYSQYIARLRVAEAKRLLQSPSHQHYKIAAIAFESGFNSLSSFNAYFKKIVGITAKAYRENT